MRKFSSPGTMDYDVVCDSEPMGKDMHDFLAYHFNVKLVGLFNKYHRSHEVRTVRMWINEYDHARVLVLYRFDRRSFEEVIIDWLFTLRDMLVTHKMDFNSFRYYVVDNVVLAAHKSPRLFWDLQGLLKVIGCSVRFDLESLKRLPEEHVFSALESLRLITQAKPEEFIKATIKVSKWFGSGGNTKVQITNVVPESGKKAEHTTKVMTDKNGVAVVPVPKYSVLKVKVGRKTKTIVVADKDVSINIKTLNIKPLIILGLIAGASLAVFLLIF